MRYLCTVFVGVGYVSYFCAVDERQCESAKLGWTGKDVKALIAFAFWKSILCCWRQKGIAAIFLLVDQNPID
jgi:hypothetical protein